MTCSGNAIRTGYSVPTAKSIAFWERDRFEPLREGLAYFVATERFIDGNREFPEGGVVVTGDGATRGMTIEDFHLTNGDNSIG